MTSSPSNTRRALIKAMGATPAIMKATMLLAGVSPNQVLLASNREFKTPVLGQAIDLPRDHGVHPEFRNEWWYFTGWFEDVNSGKPLGLQITFFRTAPDLPANSASRFNPGQILLAHAAVADPAYNQLKHAQTIRRVDNLDTFMESQPRGGTRNVLDLQLPNWRLVSTDGQQWQCEITTASLSMQLRMTQSQPPWAQGNQGYSRKGPLPDQSSFYLSLPHMESEGEIIVSNQKRRVKGSFWMDHEWFSSYLDSRAQGWDWVGLHGDDGSAIMAFQIRSKTPGAPPLWSYGAIRSASGEIHFYKNVHFEPIRSWTSIETSTTYPVDQRLIMDDDSYTITALFDNQELDSRATSGTIYWEGAVLIKRNTQAWGRGYMELTGYNEALGL